MYVQANTSTSLGWRPQLGGPAIARRRVRVRRGLGDDGAILNQVFSGQSGAPAADNVRQVVTQAMANQSLYTSENCSGIVSGQSTTSLVLSSAGAAALKFAGATGPAAPFVLIAGGVMEVFGAIFGHHAQKVKQEQQIICAVVQSVNDSLSVIDQALTQNQITGQQASASLDKLYSDLTQNVQPILKQDSSHCNAACFILAEARGVIAKRKDEYSKILPPQASAACAAAYWKLYPDVAGDNTAFGTSFGPAGAWLHYTEWGQKEGRTWPCDATGAPLGSQSAAGAAAAAGDPIGAVTALVNSAAASTGLPSIAIWGIGGLLLFKLLRG